VKQALVCNLSIINLERQIAAPNFSNPNMNRNNVSLILLLCPLLFLSGCDSAPSGTTRVTGTITIDGKPVESGLITFTGADGGPLAFPVKQGKYEAFLLPGEKEVTFMAREVIGEEPSNDYPGDTRMLPIYGSIVSEKYTKKGATKITVGDKRMQHDFPLTND
jgi:hypothetical protein